MTLEVRNRHINNPDGFTFDVCKVTRGNRFDVLARVEPFHNQLSLAKGRTLEELYRNVSEGVEAVFAQEEGSREDIAVAVQRLRVVNLFGHEHRVIKRFLRAVLIGHQQQGAGTALTNEAIERLRPDAITGRTPNPYVFGAEENSPYVKVIYPIHKLYNSLVRTILVAVLDDTTLRETHERTGIQRGAYPPGENRLFSLEGASRRNLKIYHRMIDGPPEGLGADLAAGDGIRYLEIIGYDLRGSDRFRLVAT